MASLTETIQKIKCGKVVGLQPQVQTLLSSEKNGSAESQQIIRYCSRYVYENPELEEGIFSSILDIVSLCCGHQKEQNAGDPSYNLKSMYYIILTAVKRKDFFCYLVGLLTVVEPIVKQCNTTTGDSHSIIKSLYQSLWNTSLTLSDPLQALTLQRFSLQYLIVSGMNVNLACSQTVKAHLNYEDAVKSAEHLDKFYQRILSSLLETVQKQKTFNEDVILNMCNLVMEYAKVLLKLNQCANFSKVSKALVALCEKNCNEQILLALKIGLKMAEVGMAFKVGRCGGEMMRKLVGSCSMAPKVLIPNTIVLRSILAVLAMFRIKDGDQVTYSLEKVVLSCLLDALLARCQAPVSEEDARKVATVLDQHLGCFVKMIQTSEDQRQTSEDQTKTSEDQTKASEDQSKTTRDQERVLAEALPWLTKTKSFMSRQPKCKADWVWQMYNVGVNSGNIGVLAFRANKCEMAAKFLEVSVDMLDQYRSVATQQQVGCVLGLLSKRVKTLSDALRYSGQHWEAGVAVGQGLVRGCLPLHDLVTIWVKCKRDSEKGGSKTLQGVTVCDVVSEARRRHQGTEGFTFNTVLALKEEIKCYKSQGCNNTEDELSCGRKLAEEGQGVGDQARGLLAVAVALVRSQKGATACLKAIKSVNSAITLLEGAKLEGKNTCGERELLAQAHFWLYLCQLQHSQITTEAVQELEKSPTSLTTQATDLGEEVQVDDACDVQPSALSVTLPTHEASLAPLNTALTIWQDLVAQGVELEDLETTCDTVASAGYVYQVCGFVTPTLACWAALVSFARSHRLHTLLVKGVTELMLVAPELVPEDLVREAEVALGRCQEDAATTPQDTSPSYLTTSLLAATALYCLKHGQYKEGALHLSRALTSDTMEKQTIGSTEVQTLVHLAASQYALLPPHLLPAPPTTQPAYFYAILASRQAIALIRSTPSCNQGGVVCWRHRVTWLLLTTTAWLGRLCLASAQPRVARVYLKQSLSIAQQFTLALWMAELLEILARVDLMCDQFDDCRVKVESLQGIIAVHSKHSPTHHTLTPTPCSVEAAKSTAKKTKHKVIQKHVDRVDRGVEEEQWMRAESTATDYNVKTVVFNPSLVVVGNEKRLPILTKPHLVSSPSMVFREDVSLVRVVECPDGVVGCVLCSTPLLHHLLISTGHLLAMLHAYAGRHRPAITCLNRALEMYFTVNKKVSEISTHLSSIVRGKAKGEEESRSLFVNSRLNEVRLRIYYGRAEVLALEERVEDALTTNMEALAIINTLPNKLLYQDMHIMIVLQLQGVALQKMIAEQQVKSPQSNENPHEMLLAEEEKSRCDFNTPVRTRGPLADPTSCLKSARKFFKTRAVEREAFSIFSDDENEGPSRLAKTVAPKTYQKSSSKTYQKSSSKTVKKEPTNSFSKPKSARSLAKKKVEDMNDVSSQFNLLKLSDSPSDIVLEVPKSAQIRTYKKSPQQNMKDVKKVPATISSLPSSRFVSKPEKEVRRRGRPTKLDSESDKTSPNSSQSSDAPSDIVLEVPKSAQIRTYKKSPQQNMKDVKKVPATISSLPSSRFVSKPEKEVRRRGRPTKLDSESDKTSPDSSQSSDAPSDIVLEVPKSAQIRTYKKYPQQNMKDVKKIPATSSNLPSSRFVSKPEKEIRRRGRPPKLTTKLDSDSDKTSPDSSQSSDGTELFQEPKTVASKARTATKGTREKTATSRSRSKEVPVSKPEVRSRVSRSLRLI